MVTPNRKTRPPAAMIMTSPRRQYEAVKRQIITLASCALSLFLVGTFVLMIQMPDPTSMLHGVDNVVQSSMSHFKHSLAGKPNAKEGEASQPVPKKKPPPTAAYQPKLREQVSQSKHKLRMTESDPQSSSPPPRLIHILETRFMQNQPHLIELAKARLHLFATICLPTVLQQSAWGEFVWVIRTDPDLDGEIRQNLISLLKQSGALREVAVGDKQKEEGSDELDKRSLTYVVGSNDNYILANSTSFSTDVVKPFDIRHMLGSMMSNPDSVFAGRVSSAQSLLEEINSKKSDLDHGNDDDVVLWTRLDADDGLNLGYMEYIQSQAVRYFLPEYYGKDVLEEFVFDKKTKLILTQGDAEHNLQDGQLKMKNNYSPPKWTYWCAGRNIDWFITDAVHDPSHRNGTVFPVQHVNVCVTPGVTVALRGSFNPMDVPRLDHDKIISYLRPQGSKLCHRSGISVFDESKDNGGAMNSDKEEPDDGSCFHMVNAYYFAALRSRTPTSAGMLGISPTETQLQIIQRQPILTYAMWVLMGREFGVSNKSLIRTNDYFADHVYDIAEENARGQCTQGHSCKTSSKDLLQQYADLKSERKGGFDIIDGYAVHTTNKVDQQAHS